MPRPLHRAGVRPPGGGFEGRTESCLAVDYGDDQPRPRPGLGRRLRGTCAWAPGRGPPHLSSDPRPRGRQPDGRRLPGWRGSGWLQVPRPTLKEQRDGWLGMRFPRAKGVRGAARPLLTATSLNCRQSAVLGGHPATTVPRSGLGNGTRNSSKSYCVQSERAVAS